jgi:hypothetical protein
LFDSDLELCNFADQVNCNTDGNAVEQSLLPPPAPAPLTTTSSPVLQKQPDLSSTAAGGLDDKEWPASSTTAPASSKASAAAETEQDDSDLPPWLAHVVKDSDSSSDFLSCHYTLGLLLISAAILCLDLM